MYNLMLRISQVKESYCTAGKFVRELNLAVKWIAIATAKLKFAKIINTEPPNLNAPIYLQ